jgi:DNA-binding response OmpR family regulator
MSYWKRRCCSECGTVLDSGEAKLVRGPLTLDRALRRVVWRGVDIHFTKTEFEIVDLLAQREGRIVQHWAFFIDIIDEDVEDKILDVYVCRIRSKFVDVDPAFDLIQTIWGEGLLWKKCEPQAAVAEVPREQALRERLARAAA